MATPVIMPQLGESVVEGTVGRWLVAEGQPIKQYDPLVQVTTDKVDTEITATASGILLKIYVAEGQTVERGTVLGLIGQPDETRQEHPAAGPGTDHEPDTAEAEAPVTPPAQGLPVAPPVLPLITPVAQRMALEHGVDLGQVQGSGPGGRITKEDVASYLEGTPAGDRAQALAAGSRAVPAAPGAAGPAQAMGFISPVVSRLAAEHRVDLTQVTGTGEGGRVTKKDLLAYIAGQGAPSAEPVAGTTAAAAQELPPWEQPGSGSLFKPTEELGVSAQAAAQAPAPAAPARRAQPAADVEVRPLSITRRSIAKHMLLSKSTSAHVTTVMEADMTRVVQAREHLRTEYERQGVKLTFTPFLLQALVAGLRLVPEANSSLDGDNLVVHRHIHIGIAVAVADGLIVPVIRDCDEKSLLGLARAVNDLAERARAKRLVPDEVQGGTFTLTNHGTAGSLFATPIINQPQAGILGVGAIQKRPVVISQSTALLPGPDDTIAIRPMAYLSFTFDHRILDGAGADSFLMAVKQFLEGYRA